MVAQCADLALVSDECARLCMDRPMLGGGQNPMGVWCPKEEEEEEEEEDAPLWKHTWHVAINGDDDQGIGSKERPMATISHALGRARSDDLIRLTSGEIGRVDPLVCYFHRMPLGEWFASTFLDVVSDGLHRCLDAIALWFKCRCRI